MKNVFLWVGLLLMAAGGFAWNKADFMPELVSNTADLTYGEAVFKICNPANVPISFSTSTLKFFFTKLKGDIKHISAFYMREKNVTVSYENFNMSVLKSEYVPLPSSGFLKPSTCYNVLVHADWTKPAFGTDAVLIDWVPGFNVSGVLYNRSEWSWWNVTWPYNQNVSVSSSSFNISAYALKLFFNSSSLGTLFNWSLLGNDIRFLDSADINRPFWIESFNQNNNFTVWIKSNISTGGTALKMYYGNMNASNASSFSNYVIDSATLNSSATNYQAERGSGIKYRPGVNWESWSGGSSSWTFTAQLNGSPIDLIYDGGLSGSNCGGSSCSCSQTTTSGKYSVECGFYAQTSCSFQCYGGLSFDAHAAIPDNAVFGVTLNIAVTSMPSYTLFFQNLSYQITPAIFHVVNVQSPTAGSYVSTFINLSFTPGAEQVTECKYTLNGVDHALSYCQNTTISAAHGNNNLTVFALDSLGYWGSSPLLSFNAGQFSLYNCTGGNVTLEVDLKNEENNSAITGELELVVFDTLQNNVFGFSVTNSSSAKVCLSPVVGSPVVSVDLHYSSVAGGYSMREYFLVNQSLSSASPLIVPLYLSDSATEMDITVKESSGQVAGGVIVKFQRYFLGENAYKTVAMIRSDPFGKAMSYLKLPEYYRLILERDGMTLRIYDKALISATASPPKELSLWLSDSNILFFEYYNKLTGACNWNNNSLILLCSYSDTSGLLNFVYLSVERLSLLNASVDVCSTSTTGATGSLSCAVNATMNTTHAYQFFAVLSDGSKVVLDSGWIEGPSPLPVGMLGGQGFGRWGLFVAIIGILTTFLLFSFSVSAGLIGINLFIIGMKILGIILIGWSSIIILIILSVIVALKVDDGRHSFK